MTATDTSARKLFETLVREHHHRLLAYAMALGLERETARDLVQDAFLVAFAKLDSFDPTRDFGAWVRGIVRHKYLQWIAKRRETPLDPALLDDLEQLHAEWAAAAPDRESLFAHLRRCITRLPAALQQAVHGFYYARHTCEALAQTCGTEPVTIRKRLQRAREALEACLRQALAEEER